MTVWARAVLPTRLRRCRGAGVHIVHLHVESTNRAGIVLFARGAVPPPKWAIIIEARVGVVVWIHERSLQLCAHLTRLAHDRAPRKFGHKHSSLALLVLSGGNQLFQRYKGSSQEMETGALSQTLLEPETCSCGYDRSATDNRWSPRSAHHEKQR